MTGCILSNVNTPSMTPVIGQPQQETPPPSYQNGNVPTKPTAGRPRVALPLGLTELAPSCPRGHQVGLAGAWVGTPNKGLLQIES